MVTSYGFGYVLDSPEVVGGLVSSGMERHSGQSKRRRPPLQKEKAAREDIQVVHSLLVSWTNQQGNMVAQGGLIKGPGPDDLRESYHKTPLCELISRLQRENKTTFRAERNTRKD